MTDKHIDHVDHIVKAEEHLVLVALAMAGLDPASQPDTDDLREFLFEGLQDLVSRAHLELNKI